jgi:hypothetical protein
MRLMRAVAHGPAQGDRIHGFPCLLLHRRATPSPPLHPALPAGTLLHPRPRTIWRPTRDPLPCPSRRLSLLSPQSPPSSPQSRRPPSTLRRRSPRPQRLRLDLSPHPFTRCAPPNQDRSAASMLLLGGG